MSLKEIEEEEEGAFKVQPGFVCVDPPSFKARKIVNAMFKFHWEARCRESLKAAEERENPGREEHCSREQRDLSSGSLGE
jgi:hypothetical protein